MSAASSCHGRFCPSTSPQTWQPRPTYHVAHVPKRAPPVSKPAPTWHVLCPPWRPASWGRTCINRLQKADLEIGFVIFVFYGSNYVGEQPWTIRIGPGTSKIRRLKGGAQGTDLHAGRFLHETPTFCHAQSVPPAVPRPTQRAHMSGHQWHTPPWAPHHLKRRGKSSSPWDDLTYLTGIP